MGIGIRRDSVRGRLRILHESEEVSVVDINRLVAEEELGPSLDLWYVSLSLNLRGVIPSLGLMSVYCGDVGSRMKLDGGEALS